MNDKAKIVLWLGLIMILLQIIKAWQQIAQILFTGSGLDSAPSSIPPVGVVPDLTPGNEEEPPAEEEPPPEIEPVPEIPAILASLNRTT